MTPVCVLLTLVGHCQECTSDHAMDYEMFYV